MTVNNAQENDKEKASLIEEGGGHIKTDPVKYARLPCRGCIASCKNYDHCDGKLWRMSE